MTQSPAFAGLKGDRKNDDGRTPRWVKVFGSILLVLILLFLIMHLTGVIGRHGPSRHMPSGVQGGHAQPEAGR